MTWYGYALISAGCIAIVGLLQKKTLQQEHTVEYVALYSSFKVLLFFAFFWSAIDWRVTGSQATILILDGLVGAGAFFAIAKAIRRLELSTVLPLLSLESGLAALLAFIVLQDALTGTQLLGLLFLLIGTFVLELRHYPAGWWKSITEHPSKLFDPFREVTRQIGGHYIILGLVCYAIASVTDRYILQQVPVNTYLAYVLLTIAVVYLIMFARTKQSLSILRPGRSYLLWLILIIAVLHLTASIAHAHAVSVAAVGLVIALKRLSVLFDVIVGGKFFHEHQLPQKVFASIIMLIGVFFVVRG